MSQISNLTSNSKYKAIIVAGGSGTRMKSATPKQFLLLNGRPLLFYTLEAFYNSVFKPDILLVIHPDFHSYWEWLCADNKFTVPHQLIAGGEMRFHSVKNGLAAIADADAVIAVQDAVRPLTEVAIIDRAYRYAEAHGNAVAGVKSRDSIRQVKDGVSASLIRDEIYLIQTPQTFTATQLNKAYEQPFNDTFTDDASVVEKAGFNINLVEGSYNNIKITFPDDIAIAEMLLNKMV